VAIKVLPASVAGDTDRLARFQKPACLNHVGGIDTHAKVIGSAVVLVSVAFQGDLASKQAIQIDEVDCRERTCDRPPDQSDP
jgi:hypothetical protein